MYRKATTLLFGVLFPFFLFGQTETPPSQPQATWGIDVLRPVLYGAWMISGEDPGMGIHLYRFKPSASKPKVTHRSTFGLRYLSGNLIPARWGTITVPFPEKEPGIKRQFYEIRYAPGKSWNFLNQKGFQMYGGADLPINLGYLKSKYQSSTNPYNEYSFSGTFGITGHIGVLLQLKKWPHQMRIEVCKGVGAGIERSRNDHPLLTTQQRNNAQFLLTSPTSFSLIVNL